MTYISALELWKSLGLDVLNNVRGEVVGTGAGTSWELDQRNVVSGSETIYTDGSQVGTASYTLDLDEGDLTLTAGAGVTVSADYDYADIPDSHIQDILNRTDEWITNSTGRIFATTTTTEYIDVEDRAQDEYFLTHWPVTTISTLKVNTASSLGDTAAWSSSTQGIGNDFITDDNDLAIGRFRWIDNFPPSSGKNRLEVVYIHGYTDTPEMVKELATLVATKQMINSTIYQTIFKGRDDSSPINLDVVDRRIEALMRKLQRIDIEKP